MNELLEFQLPEIQSRLFFADWKFFYQFFKLKHVHFQDFSYFPSQFYVKTLQNGKLSYKFKNCLLKKNFFLRSSLWIEDSQKNKSDTNSKIFAYTSWTLSSKFWSVPFLIDQFFQVLAEALYPFSLFEKSLTLTLALLSPDSAGLDLISIKI